MDIDFQDFGMHIRCLIKCVREGIVWKFWPARFCVYVIVVKLFIDWLLGWMFKILNAYFTWSKVNLVNKRVSMNKKEFIE